MIVPEMGRTRPAASRGLASALFTGVQQRVVGLIFGQPDRRFRSSEIIRLAAGGTGAVHRQLQRLAGAGLVTVTVDGNQKYYQANPRSPIYAELHGIAVKTSGLAEPIRAALAPIASKIDVAFIHGSVAKGTDRAASDVDLLVIADRLDYPALYEALQTAEQVIGRPINPTVMKRAEWRRKSGADSFVTRIASHSKIFIIGSEDDL